MKSWDVIIIGGGIIGLSLALALRKRGSSVLVIERGRPGHEASHAAAGMLAHCDPHTPAALRELVAASARLYPEFIHELEDKSGERVDLRRDGTIVIDPDQNSFCGDSRVLDQLELRQLEPALAWIGTHAEFWPEASVDPRALGAAAWKACKHRNVDISSGDLVRKVRVENGQATGVIAEKAEFASERVVNCAGAWASHIAPLPELAPTRPVKGQMLAVVPAQKPLLSHVVRAPQAYLVPRSDSRILIGTTLEEAGFDKKTQVETIQRMREGAAQLVPEIKQCRILEDWAGLRPGTPDDLPILGSTPIAGYFIATGHYRDGILLSAITADLMADLITGATPKMDLAPFSPLRFRSAMLQVGA